MNTRIWLAHCNQIGICNVMLTYTYYLVLTLFVIWYRKRCVFSLTYSMDSYWCVLLTGKLQKPDISVNDESSHDITIACVLPESVSDGHSCNLYTGDQPQAYKEAWVRRFNAASSKLFCTFSVTKNDLFRHLQLERDVSCDYRVNTGSHSLSPRSDKYIITGKILT